MPCATIDSPPVKRFKCYKGYVTDIRRPATRVGAGGRSPYKIFRPPGKCVGHSLKNLGPCQKTLRPTWCPKLVTDLDIRYWIWYVASARNWGFPAQIAAWFCAVAHLTGNTGSDARRRERRCCI